MTSKIDQHDGNGRVTRNFFHFKRGIPSGALFFNREAINFFECAALKISGGATQEAVSDFAHGICVESMGGFFHLKKERELYTVSLCRIFLDKNSRSWTRKGFFSKKLFPI